MVSTAALQPLAATSDLHQFENPQAGGCFDSRRDAWWFQRISICCINLLYTAKAGLNLHYVRHLRTIKNNGISGSHVMQFAYAMAGYTVPKESPRLRLQPQLSIAYE